MRMTVLLRAAALPFLLAAGGCYRYEPIEAPRPGMDVRARLETEAAVRRSAGLDEPVVFLSGRVVESTPESLTLDVLIVRDPSVFSNIEIRDTVNVGMAEIRELTVRSMSTSRSLLFAGALGAGAYLVIRGITAIVGGNEGDDDGGGPQFDRRASTPLRFPIFSIPIP
jgi:hypothetical protein